MKILLFLLLFPLMSFSQVLTDLEIKEDFIQVEPEDTKFFSAIYYFYSLSSDEYLKMYLSRSWDKYFLPRIMCGKNYLSGVQEILPKFFLSVKDTNISLRPENFLNLDHMEYYSKKDLDKIYFVSSVKNVMFFTYINENGEMEKFLLEVYKEDGIWFIYAKEIEDTCFVKKNTIVVLPHRHTQ